MNTETAVLLVDDEPLVLQSLRQQLRRLLGSRGITIECAAGVAEAWEIITDLQDQGVRLVLVVSDWLMPHTRDDVFLADVQARLPNIRRVLLTGQADNEAVQTVVRQKIADRLVFKPWSEEDLRDAMNLVLREP